VGGGKTSKPEIHATITDGHRIWLSQLVPEIQPLLEYRQRVFRPTGPAGYQESEELLVAAYDNKSPGPPFVLAGFWPRIREVLHDHGYRVKIEDRRHPRQGVAVDEAFLRDCDDDERLLLDAVVHQDLGQIEVSSQEDALTKACLIRRLWPKAVCVTAVATYRTALWWQDKLEERLQEPIELRLPGANSAGRWVVGTYTGIRHCQRRQWDILFLAHGEEAPGMKAIEMFFDFTWDRVYAFVQPQRRPDRYIRWFVEMMAGPVIHHLAKPRARVRVVLLATPSCVVPHSSTALAAKRANYWANSVRNAHIAAVAQAMATGDRQALKHAGLRNKDIRLILAANKSRLRVLVESPEHGRQLLTLLPGWRLLDKTAPDAAATEPQERANSKGPAIVTATYAATERVRTDVLIRATGTEWALRMKRFPPRRDGTRAWEVLLIDFADSFSPQVQNDTQCRLQDYERRGFLVSEHPNLAH
jgi:hypothetical protein